MKKLILLVIFTITTVSCELFSPSYWNKVSESRKNRGEECYRTSSGYFYCEDRYGNRD